MSNEVKKDAERGASEPVAWAQVFRCKIKSKKQIDAEIPRGQQGWWADVAAGQTLRLRQATQADLDRCTLGGERSKNPADYMCETFTGGSLVSKAALEYMNPEQNVFATTGAAPQAEQRQEAVAWKNVLPGGRVTDKWESARVADYNQGWNDYRKAAKEALEMLYTAPQSLPWVGLTDELIEKAAGMLEAYATQFANPAPFQGSYEGMLKIRAVAEALREKNAGGVK